MGLLTYNILSKYDPESRWQKRVKFVSKLLGCYKVLKSAELEEMWEALGTGLGCGVVH